MALLREGWTSLHLDARKAGVIVPTHLRGEAHLVLQYGHDLPIPIPDLEIDDYGVRATLSFSKTPHLTVVPWTAVYVVACDDGRGVLYHEDVPDEVSILASRAPAQSHAPAARAGFKGQAEAESAAPQTTRFLRSVPADPVADEAVSAESLQAELATARRRRRPQLRVVK